MLFIAKLEFSFQCEAACLFWQQRLLLLLPEDSGKTFSSSAHAQKPDLCPTGGKKPTFVLWASESLTARLLALLLDCLNKLLYRSRERDAPFLEGLCGGMGLNSGGV